MGKLQGSGPQRVVTLKTRGVILISVLILLLTVSLIGATLASFFLSVTISAELQLARAQALYLAEAGVAQTIRQHRQASLMGGEAQQAIPSTSLGEGEYKVAVDLASGLVTSTGKAHGVQRTVQVKYYPF